MNKKIIIALLIVAAVMGITSCDLIGGIFAPAYVGTWSMEETVDVTDMKMTMILEKEAWEMNTQVKINSEWVDVMAIKGTMEGEDDALTITATDVMAAVEGTFPEEWTELSAEEAKMYSMGEVTWAVDGDKLTISDPDNAENKTVLTKVK